MTRMATILDGEKKEICGEGPLKETKILTCMLTPPLMIKYLVMRCQRKHRMVETSEAGTEVDMVEEMVAMEDRIIVRPAA